MFRGLCYFNDMGSMNFDMPCDIRSVVGGINRTLCLVSLGFLIFFPIIALAEEVKCPKGYQPYANRCISQKMADYISCVEASGGNRQQISEEISAIGGQKTSTGITASGSGAIVKGAGSLSLNKRDEKALVSKLETRWFPNGMSECSKVLDKTMLRDIKKEVSKTNKSQEQILINQKEILNGQAEIKKMLSEKMDKTESERHSELLAKYPLGYCLFAVDRRNIIIPNNSVLLRDYAIDWNPAKIDKVTEKWISFKFPTIIQKKNNISFNDTTVTIERLKGKINVPVSLFGTDFAVELLDDTDKGLIFVIGFKPTS